MKRMTSFERAQHLQKILEHHPRNVLSIWEYAQGLSLRYCFLYIACPLILAFFFCNVIAYSLITPSTDHTIKSIILLSTSYLLYLQFWPWISCWLMLRHYGVVSCKSLKSTGLPLPEGFLCDRDSNLEDLKASTHTKLAILHHFEHLPARVQAMVVKRKIIYYVQ